MRRFLLVLPALLAACDDGDYGYDPSQNEIVFGIEQGVDPATNQPVVSAGYEFLGLAQRGGSFARAFRDGDGEGTCWFENVDQRLGHPRVENGVATWSGGTLPSPGLQVLANQDDPAKVPGAGWTSADVLGFTAEGFAMPPLEPVRMTAPKVEMTIGAITPDVTSGSMALSPTNDVDVAWTPTPISQPTLTRMMVTLETDKAEVRCFDRSSAGHTTIPAHWVAQLFSSAAPGALVAGHLRIASHRQTTILARGGWTVYVVAIADHRLVPFTGTL